MQVVAMASKMIKLISYAKINLFFEITSRSKTGYHFVNTLIAITEDYHDEILIEEATNFEVSTTGKYSFAGFNILQKIVDLCKLEFGNSFNANFKINIVKNIKTGSGLGGGSSNAGVFFQFLLLQNNIFLSQPAFSKLAIKVGADVSFFYNNLPKMCTGYGEIIQDVPFDLPCLYAIIILPNFEVETKKAFSLITKDDFRNSEIKTFEDCLKSINSFNRVCGVINDEICDIIEILKALPKVLKADISGSGSACFALFNFKNDAIEALNFIPKKYDYIITKIKYQ